MRGTKALRETLTNDFIAEILVKAINTWSFIIVSRAVSRPYLFPCRCVCLSGPMVAILQNDLQLQAGHGSSLTSSDDAWTDGPGHFLSRVTNRIHNSFRMEE